MLGVACARWALFQVGFRPLLEIEAKQGGGRTFVSGPSFARLRGNTDYFVVSLIIIYTDTYLQYKFVHEMFVPTAEAQVPVTRPIVSL